MIRGKAVRLGDHVDTDVIIPARYCTSIDPAVLGTHLLEASEHTAQIQSFRGTILVAGSNFGCGSAREHAAMAVQGAGVQAVVARTFSRTFFRNSINIALPVFELLEANELLQGDELEIDPVAAVLSNKRNNRIYQLQPYPAIIQEIMDAGGMVAFARKRLAGRSAFTTEARKHRDR